MITLPSTPRQAFIAGKFKDALSGQTIATVNPATGQEIASFAACNTADVDEAVAAARAAFEAGTWSREAPAERKRVLLKFADLLEGRLDDIAALDCLEGGKPITETREGDVAQTIACFRWYAELVDKIYDRVAPTPSDILGMIVREPIGVAGAVLPWNFPALMFAWKVAPALASGTSIIVKPAEQTSLSALLMAQLAAEAGIPDGVLSVLPGYGHEAGEAMGRHNGIDLVSFTGSTEVGRYFLRYSAESNLKRIVLECGGKSPQLVLADAPALDVMIDDVLAAAFWNMGENCSCGSRLIVHRSRKDELVDGIKNGLAQWKIGNPQDADTKLGPMIEPGHLEKVMGYIEAGKEEGAQIVTGGTRILEETGGYFVAPTILGDVTNSMSVAREEIFGPVLSTIVFDDEDEGIKIANETDYGLAASVWTESLDKAVKASRAIKAGTVSVNCFSEGDDTTPFGGFKQSGFGGKDKGVEALDQYTELKTIWIKTR
ncbi:aldehyde dehydrogenase [Sphingopyxis sp.]|uniref:aldehyde dehydrogenase n=1 Tax=Sphingopyxis sp. TaxID=1908224 RepID=UPI002D775DA8|nr:aldehyde dehydrogenase [Sphingopyxis sp.]HET6523099.1 aldehyde dehydrogenase [Sphingopyxis sp.]